MAAAQRVIAESGTARLRLNAVADAAGVSRQTLYRWFPTKDDLLAALTAREQEIFDEGLVAIVEPCADPAARLDAGLRYVVTYLDASRDADPIGGELAYALNSLAQALEPQVEILVRVLGDALDVVPAVRAEVASRREVAEIVLRLAISHYLIPNSDPEGLIRSIRTSIGLEPEVSPTKRGAR